MLGVKKYSSEYITTCQKKIKTDTEAYRKMVPVNNAFEPIFFNNMVLVLEQMFVHRMKGQEGKTETH